MIREVLLAAPPLIKIMIIIAVLVFMMLALFFIEACSHDKRIKSIPIRILVNGTRGKTSTARILIEALNKAGIRTMGRTTGSEAEIINFDNSAVPFVRRFGARITEAIGFTKLCQKNNAQAMVVECMALAEENQRVFSYNLIKPTHVVITNSYIDHVVEIGKTREETIWTLSRSITGPSEVYAIDMEYKDCCQALKANFHYVEVKDYENLSLQARIPLHNSNLSLAVEVCKSFGISEESCIKAACNAVGDIGLNNSFICKSGAVFIPDFAINDYECMRNAILKAQGEKLFVIYNNRGDREYRLLLARKIFLELGEKISLVYTIGDYPNKVARYFNRCKVKAMGIKVDELTKVIGASDGKCTFLALGNIKGSGQMLLKSLGGK